MIPGQAQSQDGHERYYAIISPSLSTEPANTENYRIRWIGNRREHVNAIHSQCGDRERAGYELVQLWSAPTRTASQLDDRICQWPRSSSTALGVR